MDRLGTKWVAMIITLLARPNSPELRFAELAKAMPGVSHRMLSQELKRLTTGGLVSRRLEDSVPPKVFYRLTPQTLARKSETGTTQSLPRPAGSDHQDVHQIGWSKVQSVRLRNSQYLEAR